MIKRLERVSSGIPGFDEISRGGMPKGMQVLGPFEGMENLMSGSARTVQIGLDEGEAEK